MNMSILKALLFCLSPEGYFGLPALLWGPPGSGKTAMMRGIANLTSLYCHRVSPAEQGEGMFGVVPVPGSDGFLHYPAPVWAQKLANGGLLFVDEISSCPPALQAPLLGLVQLRVLGDHHFSPRVRIVAAANETADAAGGWDLAPPLCNRFGHFDFEGFDAQTWSSGLLSSFHGGETVQATNAEQLEAHVLKEWPGADAQSRGLVSGFILRRPDLLHKQPTRGQSQKAWPSRRSCDYARAALTSARIHNLAESDTDTLLAAFVGQAWVGEFRTWAALADLPNPTDVCDRKVKFAHDPMRLDRSLATLGACAALVVPTQIGDTALKQRKDRADVVWSIIGDVLKDAADITIPAARALIDAKLLGTTTATGVLFKLMPVLTAAGINRAAA